MNWKELLASEIKANYHAAEGLIRLAEKHDLNWKPESGTNWMTLGQLIKHLEDACGEPARCFVTGDWGMPAGMDPADMKMEDMLPPAEKLPATSSVQESLEALARDRELALSMLEQVSEEDLATRPTPAPWNPTPMPLGQRLLSMVEHLNLHKAQLFYYLKLKEESVHTGHLWGM
jgi:hypothetical protein